MTLDEGKNLFLEMNGSTFMMARKDQMKYNSYLELCITKETENLWRQELLDKYHNEIQLISLDRNLWVLFDSMYDLVETIRNVDNLSILENSLIAITPKLNNLERIIIAETINGRGYRKARTGLIYLSFDLNDKAKAKTFANMSLDLLNINTEDIDLLSRVKNGKILCKKIIKELRI